MTKIPYEEIDTVFLDAGNTILHMNFEFLSEGFSEHGFACDGAELARAEAAARPALSRKLAAGVSTEGKEIRNFWVENIVRHLASTREGKLDDLLAWLWSPQVRTGTWSVVPPGLVEELERLKAAGYKLVVVSNADGNVERWIKERGLRHTLDAVVDSGILGIEKPDPKIFQHALALAGSRPERTIHIGDIYSVDVVGARAAGCHGILLDPYGDWHPIDCECVPDVHTVARKLTRTLRT